MIMEFFRTFGLFLALLRQLQRPTTQKDGQPLIEGEGKRDKGIPTKKMEDDNGDNR